MEESFNNPIPDDVLPVDATAALTVTSDGMHASITLFPPQGTGSPLPLSAIKATLTQKGITFGIDENQLQKLYETPVYNMSIIVATGQPPVHGSPASVTQIIVTDTNLRPKELEDGTVDYKDLGIVHSVRQGDILCTKIPSTPGTPGINVYGIQVPAKPGRDVPMPVGKNTVLSEDKLQLLAACDGQADKVGNKIQVLNTFTVKGNVGNSTGNISFLGHVQVDGNVLTGFMIQATGNVTVNGSVEGAQIVAGGNIVLKGGLNGSGKGFIKSGGTVKSKYIQSGTVEAAGDIETSYILHSTIQSGGNVIIVGSKGTIIGGHICAVKSISTAIAGSRSSYVPTTLEVGTDPSLLSRSRAIPRELEANKRDVAALTRVISLLGEHKKAGRLTPDKFEQLQRAIQTYQTLNQTAADLEEELRTIQETLENSLNGSVNISITAHPGVRIVIGSDTFVVESNYDHCTFIRSDQQIQMVPLR